MAKKSKTFSIRLTEDTLAEIKEVSENRNAFIIEAIHEKLKSSHLSNKEKKEVTKAAKSMSDLLQDAIVHEMTLRQDFLSTMSNEDLAKLVASRLPKEEQSDAGLEEDVLSLKSCLSELPLISDITHELNVTKGKLARVEMERDIANKALKYSQGKNDLASLLKTLYEGVVSYVVEMVIRNSLPGLGEGKGLSEKGYKDISDQVEREIKRINVLGLK